MSDAKKGKALVVLPIVQLNAMVEKTLAHAGGRIVDYSLVVDGDKAFVMKNDELKRIVGGDAAGSA